MCHDLRTVHRSRAFGSIITGGTMTTFVADRFAGKTALITGTGSGIGRAVAVRLAAEGAQVLAHELNAESLAETVRIITEAGGTVVGRQGDVTSRAECFAAVEAAVATFGKLDVLGNVAGIAAGFHMPEQSEDSYRRMVAINQDAPFFFCQAAIPHLLETNGNIVNIASNAGINGQAYTVSYCMTKGAVIQLTKALAMEFMKKPIRINAIAPGGVATTLSNTYQMPGDIDMDLLGRYMGFRGMAEPEELASMFSLVASDESVNIHGAVLSSDRGMTAG